MKNIYMAVLLIAANGVAVYFFFFNKKKAGIQDYAVHKELIIGKWKLDSLILVTDLIKLFSGFAPKQDSNFSNYAYQFSLDGKITRLLNDSVQKDTSRYEWTKEGYLLFKKPGDSVVTQFTVSKLNDDSLVLISKGSTVAVFSRVK